MRVTTWVAIGLLALATGAAAREARAELPGPYVFKSSVRINTRKFLVYYPTPTAKEPQYKTCSWAPRFEFNMLGPLEGGSQVSVTFTKPDGTRWFSSNLNTSEISADSFASFSSDALDLEKQAIITTGVATMTVNLSNSLTKSNKTLFVGKFTVGKFYWGPNEAAKPKDSCDYYVNHDWNLPIGQMAFDTKMDAEAPRLRVHLWFRGQRDEPGTAAYLFYKGKQIASTKTGGGANEMVTIETGTTRPDTRWGRYTFSFNGVSSGRTANSANNYTDMFWLDKNPGPYEMKVLRQGKLARTVAFSIGDDGKLVDNGLADKNNMGFGVILVPVKVEPGIDPKADISNYKSQAYYGNPVSGFP